MGIEEVKKHIDISFEFDLVGIVVLFADFVGSFEFFGDLICLVFLIDGDMDDVGLGKAYRDGLLLDIAKLHEGHFANFLHFFLFDGVYAVEIIRLNLFLV